METRRKRLVAAQMAVSQADLPQWERVMLALVAVKREPVTEPEVIPRLADTSGTPLGWALWPSTMQIGKKTTGDALDPDAPLLEGAWAVGGVSYRLDEDVVTRIDERELAPNNALATGEVPALRERVTLLCEEPKGMRAVFHVFWMIDENCDAPVRSFDRFVGYEKTG
ncbi:hypothetical protein [Aliiruegeria sabulilitoris]|uniref:hypothetical protein n=1 Tax=Aliiruegeria sabulilitoris TaxID=1510458 RepID=UPI0012E38F46|nr:hypothetical protein [Aliiruegeria sabulilitoris]NDR55374.1 hypothetical protein [Pseudoruegeria sp. M32A2M]